MSTRRPRFDDQVAGMRVRVYATRSEYEVLVGEGEISDPNADVWVFPKVGSPSIWAGQARANFAAEHEKATDA